MCAQLFGGSRIEDSKRMTIKDSAGKKIWLHKTNKKIEDVFFYQGRTRKKADEKIVFRFDLKENHLLLELPQTAEQKTNWLVWNTCRRWK